MFKSKGNLLERRESGFSLFEVIVALVVAVLFFLLVIQISTLSSISRSQTLEAGEVLTWLQKDIESVKYQASNFQLAKVKVAHLGDSTVYLNNIGSERQFQAGDIVEFITTSSDGMKYSVDSTQTKLPEEHLDGAFNLASPLLATYPEDSIVVVRSRQQSRVLAAVSVGSNMVYLTDTSKISAGSELMFGGVISPTVLNNKGKNINNLISQDIYQVKDVALGMIHLKQNLKVGLTTSNSVNLIRCNASRKDLGYADELRDQMMGADYATDSSSLTIDPALTKTSTGKQYTIQRLMEIVDIPPYNMLQVRYITSPKLSNATSLDSFITRVMPDIVFYCN